uniref:Phosphatidylcholine--sterol O-acyltransferase n=1 Tax=Cyanothece sp. (strain PCC 7425 / ATCC 29141) TaxID=395961 RepID=B8HNX9_CYAP4
MRKPLQIIVLLLLGFLLALMATVVFSTKPTQSINQLYIFGDSLSDTGNVFRATSGLYPSHPTYFQGRYSNGRVWVEYLAEQFSVNRVNNFAWGGATTGNHSTGLVPGLLAQVQSFSQNHSHTPADALYVLWAGANDYLQGTTNPAVPVANTTQAIESLVRIGATKILIANLPDLGELPATRNSTNSSQLSTLTQAHNSGLRRSLKVLNQQYPDLHIVTLDANVLYHQAINEPAKFGFTQVKTACLTAANPCRNPDQFLFWDSIHPTTAGHRILANNSATALKSQLLRN